MVETELELKSHSFSVKKLILAGGECRTARGPEGGEAGVSLALVSPSCWPVLTRGWAPPAGDRLWARRPALAHAGWSTGVSGTG